MNEPAWEFCQLMVLRGKRARCDLTVYYLGSGGGFHKLADSKSKDWDLVEFGGLGPALACQYDRDDVAKPEVQRPLHLQPPGVDQESRDGSACPQNAAGG